MPGAAATLTRSINTPIPTPIRTPSAVPAGSPSPSRVAIAASPGALASPAAGDQSQALDDADIADVQNRFQQATSTPALNGIDSLLLDHVALSTPQGGSEMNASDAASWLRDHAGPGISVTSVSRGTQEVVVHVETTGWPQKDPIQSGQVSFSLRRYDANGQEDQSGGGAWKVDAITAE